MKFSDLLYISFKNFQNRKSRVFFTILGVAVAIAVVLSLVSFGYGLQRNLLAQITTQEALQTLDILPSDSKVITLDQSVVDGIAKMPNVEAVSPEACSTDRRRTAERLLKCRSMSSALISLPSTAKAPLAGRFPTSKDTKKIVISTTVANLFGLATSSPVGKMMQLVAYVPDAKDPTVINDVQLGADFQIVGVTDDTSAGGDIYILKNDVPTLPITNYQYAKVQVSDTKFMDTVRDDLINKGFIVSSLSDEVRQANQIFGIIQITLGTFGVFALIVAAIGLVNTMTISLLERTNEIGIMRAIGATPGDIKKIFLGESVIIGFLGGVSGILLGVIGSEILNWPLRPPRHRARRATARISLRIRSGSSFLSLVSRPSSVSSVESGLHTEREPSILWRRCAINRLAFYINMWYYIPIVALFNNYIVNQQQSNPP